MVVPRFVEQAIAGRSLTVYGDGSQTRSFCDVRDTVKAIVGLMSEPATIGGVYNIGSPEEISIRDLARRVIELTDGDTSPADRIQLVPYDDAYEAGFEDMQRRVPDLRRIHDAIGWAPEFQLDDTLREIIEHHRG